MRGSREVLHSMAKGDIYAYDSPDQPGSMMFNMLLQRDQSTDVPTTNTNTAPPNWDFAFMSNRLTSSTLLGNNTMNASAMVWMQVVSRVSVSIPERSPRSRASLLTSQMESIVVEMEEERITALLPTDVNMA